MMAAKSTKKPNDNVARFIVNGESVEIDADALDLGEIEDIEEHYDSDYSDLHGTQATVALIYTALKRKDPKTTWETVRRIKVTELKVDEAKRPTPAAPEAAGTQAS